MFNMSTINPRKIISLSIRIYFYNLCSHYNIKIAINQSSFYIYKVSHSFRTIICKYTGNRLKVIQCIIMVQVWEKHNYEIYILTFWKTNYYSIRSPFHFLNGYEWIGGTQFSALMNIIISNRCKLYPGHEFI